VACRDGRILENLTQRFTRRGGNNVQAVLAVPDVDSYTLMQNVAGVPLIVRVIATAVRADVDSVLIIWPAAQSPALLEPYIGLFKGATIENLVWATAFDCRNEVHWRAIASHLEREFLWLPWNWVTHKRLLSAVAQSHLPPLKLHSPVRRGDGIAVTSQRSVHDAERFLAANSGKPTDGFYSNVNRWLCRPFIRLLSHTPATPNAITLAGLIVALVAALFYSRGTYASYVAGALLFFVSGLFDEMDGMIARIKFRESAWGTWFEGFVDNVTYLALFAGITAGLHRQYGNWPVNVGIGLIAGSILSIVVIALQRKAATNRERPHEYAGRMNQLMDADSSNLISRVVRQIHIFVKKGVMVHYLVIFTVLGALPVFLSLAALGSNLTWTLALYFNRRFFRRPSLTEAEQTQITA
jgi:phosphatidylglycerophosphate synthase